MSMFLLFLSSVILFVPTNLVFSEGNSQVSPYNHITNYMTRKLEREKLSKHEDFSLGKSSYIFLKANNSSEVTGFPSHPYIRATREVTIPKQHSASIDGRGGSNFNDIVRANTIGIISSSASSKRTEKESMSSSFANYSGIPPKETVEQTTWLPSPFFYDEQRDTKVTSNVYSSDQEMYLKLDKNYAPKEIAEYILSTGDEKGITQVIGDMVQEGQVMASRDDVIRFLKAVQRALDKLKKLNRKTRLPHLPTSKESSFPNFKPESVRDSSKNYFFKAQKSKENPSHKRTMPPERNHHHKK